MADVQLGFCSSMKKRWKCLQFESKSARFCYELCMLLHKRRNIWLMADNDRLSPILNPPLPSSWSSAPQNQEDFRNPCHSWIIRECLLVLCRKDIVQLTDKHTHTETERERHVRGVRIDWAEMPRATAKGGFAQTLMRLRSRSLCVLVAFSLNMLYTCSVVSPWWDAGDEKWVSEADNQMQLGRVLNVIHCHWKLLSWTENISRKVKEIYSYTRYILFWLFYSKTTRKVIKVKGKLTIATVSHETYIC